MRFIATEKIPQMLGNLARRGRVWAPQVIRDTVNTVLFAPWNDADEISLDTYTTLSAKGLLLPATERLFAFRYGSRAGEECIGIDPASEAADPGFLFGARACDAKATAVLDSLFGLPPGQSYNDPYYKGRRESLTVITIACTSCDSACFCSSFGNGPGEKAGSDVILYPVEDGFLAEAVTSAAELLIAADPFADSDARPPGLARTAQIDTAGLQKRLPEIFADLDFWSRVSQECLSCGFCAHVCPACHCFDIFDEMRSDSEGERLRAWDSCMFSLYTQEASGHNPRPTVAHRYRNRINHKFSYFPANRGEILCTGCGRCIRGCPAGIDIREILDQIIRDDR